MSRRVRIYDPNGPIGGRRCTEHANKKQVATEHFRGSGRHKYIKKTLQTGRHRGTRYERILQSYISSQPYEIAKNGAHVRANNSPKTPFFTLKYLTRYTHEMFFEEYINFKIFRNLSHCGVIPVRRFRSHIRPQPHKLGLNLTTDF